RSGGTVENHSSFDDRTLVSAALRDRNAFALIVRRFEPPLSRYVRRLLGRSGQSTEDVLQDVFIKAYVNLNDYDRSRPFSPWLYKIAYNEAMSFLRKRRAEPYAISGDEGMRMLQGVLDDADAPAALDQSRMETWIHDALGGLDRRYRDVLVLRFLEEKSYDEISEILEIPMGTVATLINRGKKRLKRNLEATGVVPEAS
ncbi:MAG: sigma-70 family RNA polymerase sigma factor, partial [Alphaproteobacteria bacterium]|nr:sigma-70 family RNA polymerase sigma factor [Alphaproteobacteria bacterium]